MQSPRCSGRCWLSQVSRGKMPSPVSVGFWQRFKKTKGAWAIDVWSIPGLPNAPIATLSVVSLIVTDVHAGEPWPENVCRVFAGYEQKDIGYAQGDLVRLAYSRSNVLRMLRNHCGADITAKEAADVGGREGNHLV